MNTAHKLGETLVAANLITESQLRKSLAVQLSHPTKSIGEIVSKLFNIEEGVIEAIFVKNILIPALRNFVYSELSKKITTPGFDPIIAVPAIDVQIQKYQRVTVASKTFTYSKDSYFTPSTEKNFLSKINCTIKSIVLRTAYEDCIEFKDIIVEFNIKKQLITLENPSLMMEAKIRLNQILKKNQKKGPIPSR